MTLWQHPYIQWCWWHVLHSCIFAWCACLNKFGPSTTLKTALCQVESWRSKQYSWYLWICIVWIKLFSAAKAGVTHIYLVLIKKKKNQFNILLHPYTSQFHSWKTVFHGNKIQMCSLAPCFWTAYCMWPNTANIWLSEGNTVSYKMLINVGGTYNKDLRMSH